MGLLDDRVPPLDLAAEVELPLDSHALADYGRVLYWSFFFPQALSAYVVEAYRSGEERRPPNRVVHWMVWALLQYHIPHLAQPPSQHYNQQPHRPAVTAWLQWFDANPRQCALLSISLSLLWMAPLILAALLWGATGLVRWLSASAPAINWSNVVFHVLFVLALSTLVFLLSFLRDPERLSPETFAVSNASVVTASLAAFVLLAELVSPPWLISTPRSLLLTGLVWGGTAGLLLGIPFSLITAYQGSDTLTYAPRYALIVTGFLLTASIAWLLFSSLLFSLGLAVASTLFFSFAGLRLLGWINSSSNFSPPSQVEHWHISRVTPLPIAGLRKRLTKWLEHDWETGYHNAVQLLQYTAQWDVVTDCLNEVLASAPREKVVARMTKIAEIPFWEDGRRQELLFYLTAQMVRLPYWRPFLVLPSRRLPDREKQLRSDKPYRALAATFWHFYNGNPHKARGSCARFRFYPNGDELHQIASLLTQICKTTDVPKAAPLSYRRPPKPLQPGSWVAIAGFSDAARYSRLCQLTREELCDKRRFFFAQMQQSLEQIIDGADLAHPAANGSVPYPPSLRRLIQRTAEHWRDTLQLDPPAYKRDRPGDNPYVFANPANGALLSGRTDELNVLQNAWIHPQQLQPVLIYGPRGMGKTALLLQANRKFGSKLCIANIDLANLDTSATCDEGFLYTLCRAIETVAHVAPPAREQIHQEPFASFTQYLQQTIEQLAGRRLVIALDNYQELRRLNNRGHLSHNFPALLREASNRVPLCIFAFVGPNVPSDMDCPPLFAFAADLVRIRISYFSPEETAQLLNRVAATHPLYFPQQTCDYIYAETFGHPYLVQLLGHWLVRVRNQQLAAGNEVVPFFRFQDVQHLLHLQQFTDQSAQLFAALWNDVQRTTPASAPVLRVLARYSSGARADRLANALNASGSSNRQWTEAAIRQVLEDIAPYDVVQHHRSNDTWRIPVGGLRRWI